MELRPSNGQARSNPKVRLADKLDLTAARTFCARIDQTFMALVSWSMVTTDPVLIDLPMPIRTPRLTIRPKQVGDGAIAFSAVMETWQEAQPMDGVGRESRRVYSRVNGNP